MSQVHNSRAGRAAKIIMMFEPNSVAWPAWKLTPYRIAKNMGMKPSTHVRSICENLVGLGWLQETRELHRPGVEKREYTLTRAAYEWINARRDEKRIEEKDLVEWFE